MSGEADRRVPVGGQAVPGGVMMRGEHTWALALRRPDGGIDVSVHPNRGWTGRFERFPIVRGVAVLAESMSVGTQALRSATNAAAPPSRQVSRRGMLGAAALAVTITVTLFVVLPGVVAGLVASGSAFHALEGLLRLGTLVAYIGGVGLLPEIRRVFQYHGAEHKAVAAYEAGVPLHAKEAARFGTQHIRCGTNFLLTVVVVIGLVYALAGQPETWAGLVAQRVVLVPVVVGLAYEWLKFASAHAESRVVNVLLQPGLALQRLTTREPSIGQLEVAVAALRAVVPADARLEDEHQQQDDQQNHHDGAESDVHLQRTSFSQWSEPPRVYPHPSEGETARDRVSALEQLP